MPERAPGSLPTSGNDLIILREIGCHKATEKAKAILCNVLENSDMKRQALHGTVQAEEGQRPFQA
jgi:hypothetical protein